MRGICDTCEEAAEVFQAAGRTDLLCSECYINIGTAIQLYQTLCEIERAGAQSLELEAQLKKALDTLFSRVPLGGERARVSIH